MRTGSPPVADVSGQENREATLRWPAAKIGRPTVRLRRKAYMVFREGANALYATKPLKRGRGGRGCTIYAIPAS